MMPQISGLPEAAVRLVWSVVLTTSGLQVPDSLPILGRMAGRGGGLVGAYGFNGVGSDKGGEVMMRLRSRRSWFRGIALLGGLGYVMVVPTCTSFAGESLFRATDFCFIFDCQGGVFGGTIDPCVGSQSGAQTVESLGDNASQPFLNDCPVGP